MRAFARWCFVFLLISGFLGGCATESWITNLDLARVATGFAEFYVKDFPFPVSIYEEREGQWVYLRDTEIRDLFDARNNLRRRRIACEPGEHTYKAGNGNGSHAITVKVLEGKVTPVRIQIESQSLRAVRNSRRSAVQISLLAEEPVELESAASQIGLK